MTEPKKVDPVPAEADAELSDEALEQVAGGVKAAAEAPPKKTAPAGDGSVRPAVRTLLTRSS